jgi:hypothetical protein
MVLAARWASAYGLFTAGYGILWFLGSVLIGVLSAAAIPPRWHSPWWPRGMVRVFLKTFRDEIFVTKDFEKRRGGVAAVWRGVTRYAFPALTVTLP